MPKEKFKIEFKNASNCFSKISMEICDFGIDHYMLDLFSSEFRRKLTIAKISQGIGLKFSLRYGK